LVQAAIWERQCSTFGQEAQYPVIGLLLTFNPGSPIRLARKSAFSHVGCALDTQRYFPYTFSHKMRVLVVSFEIRQKRYAIIYSEIIAGVACISTPLKNVVYLSALRTMAPERLLKPRLADITKEMSGICRSYL